MTRFLDGRTDGRSDCTPRPAFAFGDAGKKTAIKWLKCCRYGEKHNQMKVLVFKDVGSRFKTYDVLISFFKSLKKKKYIYI